MSKNKEIHEITADEMHRMGFDKKGRLYWDGEPIVTNPIDSLDWGQKLFGGVVLALTGLGGLGAAVQGYIALSKFVCSTADLCDSAKWVLACG